MSTGVHFSQAVADCILAPSPVARRADDSLVDRDLRARWNGGCQYAWRAPTKISSTTVCP